MNVAQKVAAWWLVGLVEVGAWLLHLPHLTDEDDPC